jgi:3-oxoadipate enol-lactonase
MPYAQIEEGVSLYYELTGPEDAPVILQLGGGLFGRHNFGLVNDGFRERFRLLSFDARGYGASTCPRERYTIEGWADDAARLLDAVGLERAFVHGTSMGGMIAQHLALDHPERVRSLMLSATSPGGLLDKPPWRMVVATALRPLVGAKRTWPIVAPILYADRTRAAAPGRVAADLAIRRENATDGRTTMGQIAAIARHDTHERLHELGRLPVTVIHGGLDLLVPPSHGRALADGIPGSRLVMLEEAAHILTTDDEPGLARAVQEHLERAAEHERSMAR